MNEVDLLAQEMKKRASAAQVTEDFGWKNPALDCIDCVLSLNRKYKLFVLPRVYAFQRRHPEINSLSQLQALIAGYDTPLRFIMQELDYRDEGRSIMLIKLMDYLIEAQSGFPGVSELERLFHWASSVKPQDAYSLGIKGFGLAGFQYLRMLFGVQTTKPDTHITGFVSEAIGKPVNQEQALELFEEAARQVGIPIRQMDHAIWMERSS